MNEAFARRQVDSPIGSLVVVASSAGLRAVLWPGEDGSRIARSLAGSAGTTDPGGSAEVHLERAEAQLGEYFRGTRREFDLELDLHGTSFQRAAWAVLCTIPFGTTLTYGRQAAALGDAAKARAVGAANRRNPVSIVVPCHRVVAEGGALIGYAGGLSAKGWLLDHERRVLGGGCGRAGGRPGASGADHPPRAEPRADQRPDAGRRAPA